MNNKASFNNSAKKSHVRAFALLLATATVSLTASSAVKPVAVWNRDLADASARGGFTIDDNGNTIASGIATIDGTTGGVLFLTDTKYNTTHMSAVVAFSNVTAQSGNVALVTAKSPDSTRYANQAGIGITG